MKLNRLEFVATLVAAAGLLAGCGGSDSAAPTTVATTTPDTTPATTVPTVSCTDLFAIGESVPHGQPTCENDGTVRKVANVSYTCADGAEVFYNNYAIWHDDGIVAATAAVDGITQAQLNEVCGVVAEPTTVAPPTTPTPPASTTPSKTGEPIPAGASAEVASWMTQINQPGLCTTGWVSDLDVYADATYNKPTESWTCDPSSELSLGITVFANADDIHVYLVGIKQSLEDRGLNADHLRLLFPTPNALVVVLDDSDPDDAVTLPKIQSLIGGEIRTLGEAAS